MGLEGKFVKMLNSIANVLAALLLVSWALEPVVAASPTSKEYKVKVEGKSYRVKVKGTEVYVSDKSMLTAATLESRSRMRKAVKDATGCNIVDDFWLEARLAGKLDCGS